jgi:hypothetical protein
MVVILEASWSVLAWFVLMLGRFCETINSTAQACRSGPFPSGQYQASGAVKPSSGQSCKVLGLSGFIFWQKQVSKQEREAESLRV